jgi:hypothetical protein
MHKPLNINLVKQKSAVQSEFNPPVDATSPRVGSNLSNCLHFIITSPTHLRLNRVNFLTKYSKNP